MIRFDCPGCGKEFRIAPANAGKTGKCQTCGHRFVIPEAEPTAPAEPAMVAIDPCPKCNTILTVVATDVGKEVGCPYCEATFEAVAKGPIPLAPPPPETPPEARPERYLSRGGIDEKLHRRSRYEDDDEDEDDDDRPRRRRRRRRPLDRYDEECKKNSAGLMAMFLGVFGAHKFYLGYTNAGLIQMGLTILTCGVSGIIGFTEGIIYLMKTDDDFIETYQIGQREWF